MNHRIIAASSNIRHSPVSYVSERETSPAAFTLLAKALCSSGTTVNARAVLQSALVHAQVHAARAQQVVKATPETLTVVAIPHLELQRLCHR